MPAPSSTTAHLPEEQILTGSWDAPHLLAHISILVRQRYRNLRGVVILMPILGKKSKYHFKGRVHPDGTVTASHHSGHAFEGHIVDEGKVDGVLTTKHGRKLKLEGVRLDRTEPKII